LGRSPQCLACRYRHGANVGLKFKAAEYLALFEQRKQNFMKITVENTRKITYLKMGGVEFPARVGQGQSESGIAVQAFITHRLSKNEKVISKTDPRR